MIQSRCERCKSVLNDPDESAGKSAKCPSCGHPYVVAKPRARSQINVKLVAGVVAAVAVFAVASFLLLRGGLSTPSEEEQRKAPKKRREVLRKKRDEKRDADQHVAEIELERRRNEATKDRSAREEDLRRQRREDEVEARRRAAEEGGSVPTPDPPR